MLCIVCGCCSDGQLQQDTPVLFGSEQASSARATVEPVERSESSSDHQLWVDKYAPRLFTELLSDNVREHTYVCTAMITHSK